MHVGLEEARAANTQINYSTGVIFNSTEKTTHYLKVLNKQNGLIVKKTKKNKKKEKSRYFHLLIW